MPSVPWRVESSKIFLKIKKFPKFQKCPKSFPKVSKHVLNLFWVKLFENFFAQCSMEGRVFENFQNNQQICKNPKVPRIHLKSIQTCFELVLGQIFRNFFCPVFRGGSSFRKLSKKIFKIPKCPKVFPKVSKRVLNMFCGKFFEKFYAQCSMEGRVFENFQKKNQKICKIPKVPKIHLKSIQTCFELVLGQIFRNFFCPVFRGRSSFRKLSKKKFSKFQNAQKCSQKYPNVF